MYTSHGESDYNSSCSSITTHDSGHRSISDVSFGSSSSLSTCSYGESSITSCSHRPHKAHHPAWEAIRSVRSENGHIGLHHFQLLRRLGSGDIGNVYLCRLKNPTLRPSGCMYAMKVVDREALIIRKKLRRAEMEKEILGMLDHPFLPTLYAHFDASHYSCLVMEFCSGGDLHTVRQRQPHKRFNVSSVKFYAAEILLALEYLHMMGVIYRDLKPENVLLREDGHIMLTDFDLSLKCDVVPKLVKTRPDFGITTANNMKKRSTASCVPPMQPVLSCFSTSKDAARSHEKTPTMTTTSMKIELQELNPELVAEPIDAQARSFVGTHEYLAPEVIVGSGHGSAVDWWTFGLLLFELVYGRTPFKGQTNDKTLMNIMKKPLNFPWIETSSSRDLEELVKIQDLIKRLLVKNPKRRIGSLMGSVEIKRHEFFKGVNWALIRTVRPPEVPKDIEKVRKRAVGTTTELYKKDNDATYHIPQHFAYF
ncbi:protein kinase PINOID 2-like [Magnolia sinica]|uniref:protein kinase PINOID 2-like n=1 Tax=Magnolia sinica TaxID=86752 RepID=UPI002658F36F|nr:protein kinase PINOID 2-like [Magnolia sinica]